VSAFSNHFHSIAETVSFFESRIAALDGEIAVMKITDHNARHLSFLLRLRREYGEILKRCEGLAEACSALSENISGHS